MEEEDEIHQGGGQLCKFPRVANEELEEHGGGGGRREGLGGFNSNWHHSSRIIRVSRASGGKDRHSKVMTSKGLRDRRVRLSVTTAIQFYDLQDRLGYDQPSKAVEWLIKSASEAISELPSLNNTFPDTPKQPSDEKRGFHSADAERLENNTNANYQQNQNLSLSKSGCSSNSETSKGSGLSLARSDIRVNRVKARERARTRTAKEKEKEVNEQQQQPSQSHNNNNNNVPHQTASFTELLTGGMNNTNSPRGSVHHHHHHHNQGNNENETRQQWSTAPMDYFSPMLLGTSSRTQQQQHHHHHQASSTGFSLLSLPEHQAMSLSQFNSGGENHYSFIPHDQHQHQQHMNEYNLNFTISSSSSSSPGLVGYNRGTLQSNSPSLLPHQLQRFSSIDGSSSSSSSTLPFFMGHGVAAQPPQHAPSTNTMENSNQHHHHHQFSSPFDSNRLHLCHSDACRHSDQKGKPKN